MHHDTLTGSPSEYLAQNAQYDTEVEELYPRKVVEESRKRMARMTEEQLQAIKEEGESIMRALAELIHLGPRHPEVQLLINRYQRNLEHYYHVTKEIFSGLGELYVMDPRFTSYFERFAQGLADFLSQAMSYYANTEFKEIQHARAD
jgi:hypothetical protein